MKKIFLIVFAVLISVNCFAGKADTTSIHQQCVLFSTYGDSILRGTSDSVRILYNEKFQIAVDSLLKDPASFDYSFTSLKNLSTLKSEDDRFRIYTWMLPTQRGMKYNYFGFVQVYNEEKKKFRIYKLKEKDYPLNETTEFIKTADSTWYGALYYKMIHKRHDKKDQYVLLGWKGKDKFSTRKVIDVINISVTKVEFGKPVFKGPGKIKSRVILEYNASANVSLKYYEDKKMIIYDHLSSSDPRPESKGVYATYGPDLTYNGLRFKDGIWLLESDVQVGNETTPEVKEVELNKDLRIQRKE